MWSSVPSKLPGVWTKLRGWDGKTYEHQAEGTPQPTSPTVSHRGTHSGKRTFHHWGTGHHLGTRGQFMEKENKRINRNKNTTPNPQPRPGLRPPAHIRPTAVTWPPLRGGHVTRRVPHNSLRKAPRKCRNVARQRPRPLKGNFHAMTNNWWI